LIIGLSGWARSGKDTVANFLVENHGFTKLSFADPMREALVRLDPQIYVSGHIMHLAWAVNKFGWEEIKSQSPDIRGLMQRLGTEVGREMFGEDFWVNQALKKAQEFDNVVFSDTRFKNEARAIMANHGAVVRIERAGNLPANDHVSEHDLDNFPFDLHIFNNYEEQDLAPIVKEILEGLTSNA
jgi:hypothetical protein